jgi:hypothetical protein
MTHSLKTEFPFFEQSSNGQKNYEIRKFDRPFKMGDTVILQELVDGKFTGNEKTFKIGLVLTAELFEGVKKGWCIFSLLPLLPL